MDLPLNEEQRAFRDGLRSWFGEHAPEDRPQDGPDGFDWRRRWQKTLRAGGYAGLTWPREVGGAGATLVEQAVFDEEAERLGLLEPFNVVGTQLVGPVLIRHGTPWQRERFLGPLLDADEFWCQGFSEPNAGSDLAALTTHAVREDGGWRVTGQKIWTSFAHVADWCILLARTDRSSSRHRGLTFFLMDMRGAGIDLRRLRQASGDDEFNELFLDGVWISDEQVVGDVGRGWEVAMTTLMHERAGVAFSFSLHLRRGLHQLVSACGEQGLLDDPVLREQLAQLATDSHILRLNAWRALAKQADGQVPGAEGSLDKLLRARLSQTLSAFALDVLGSDAIGADSPWGVGFLRSRGDSIKGGTSEIQANILAERVLGLPRLSA